MDRTTLEQLVDKNLSGRAIAKHLGVSQSTVRYWMKKHSIVKKEPALTDSRRCRRCDTVKPRSEFYQRRGVAGTSSYCKTCTTAQTISRQRAMKLRAIEYKGGCCSSCGYSKCHAALEFHHIDPAEKDFSIGHARHTTFENIIEELDKCILLCSNCHREVHEELNSR